MLPYSPPYAQTKTEENQVLRPLGAILALLGVLLAVLGIIFHQGGFELVFALLITIFSLRIFVLWLGDAQRNQKLKPSPVPPSALYNSQTLTQPFPPQPGYFVPQQLPPSFFQDGTNQMTVPFAPAAPGVPFVPANSQGLPPIQATAPLPPSVRPPAQPDFFSQQAQAIPPGPFVPPAPSFAPGQAAPPTAMQPPITGSWTYTPGQPVPPPAPTVPGAFAQPGLPVEPWQWGQGQQPQQGEDW